MALIKIDTNTLGKEEVIPETIAVTKYDYKDLIRQRDELQVKLNELNEFIKEADKLGIVAKPDIVVSGVVVDEIINP